MKLLIADDEALTRKGLLDSIDWPSLGITQVFEADDGVNGLRLARRERPDILLCDVRMPRMDGIHMLEALEDVLPDSSFIFMSGYSDKEYLKAAIKLKAITYVEKPLDPKEIREAVLEAEEACRQKQRTRRNEQVHSLTTASALALALTRPYKEQRETIAALSEELPLRLAPGTAFTAYLVDLDREPEAGRLDDIRDGLEGFLTARHQRLLHILKHERYQVFFVFGPPLSDSALAGIDRCFQELYAPCGDFFAARGDTVGGIAHAYQSYVAAVALMQSCFFFPSGSLLRPEPEPSPRAAPLPADAPAAFAALLDQEDGPGCQDLLGQIFAAYARCFDVLPSQAKELYYRLFTVLGETWHKRKLSQGPDGTLGGVMGILEQCFSLDAMHRLLTEETGRFFDALGAQTPEDSTIYLIKQFIARNFANDSLSVREISEHVHLSTSYVCTYFKNETGQTLNQYLTACRIEKAKQLLSDPRNQIVDISAQVGYSNGNYFGKSFKKLVGLTPSEYRERALK